jgi:predicted exporter/lauroyl/myristoyl acyltransferase
MKRWLWLLLIPLALGLVRLRFDVEVLNLLPRELPVVHGLQLYQRHFASANELLVTLEASDAERAETAARSLAEHLRTATNLVIAAHWQPPWLEQPELAAELAAVTWLNQPPAVFAELTNQLANPAATLAATRERLATSFSPDEIARASFDPFGLTQLPASVSAPASFGRGEGMFASADGTFRLLFVKPRGALATYPECAAWLDALRAHTAAWQRSNAASGVTLHFTGRPVFVAEIASGMERDMRSSVLGTLGIIAVLFWWVHRRWRPLLWLLALLTLTLAGTLALGGLLIGTLNVVSMGFAAILLGLAVDYGLVMYQESLAMPGATATEVRRHIAPGIFWSAVTTAGAFLVLNFSGLPGLGQLGTLVAIGIALGALAMLYAYLPPLLAASNSEFGTRNAESSNPTASWTAVAERSGDTALASRGTEHVAGSSRSAGPESGVALRFPPQSKLALLATLALLLISALTLSPGLPPLSHSADPLRPTRSEAYSTAELISQRLGDRRDPLWLVVSGRDEAEVARHLAAIQPALQQAVSNQVLTNLLLPDALWPHPEHQHANRDTARWLAAQRETLRTSALQGGFSTNALLLADRILTVWSNAASATRPVWPTNSVSTWTLERFVARGEGGFLLAGIAYPGVRAEAGGNLAELATHLPTHGAWLTGWSLLGEALLGLVQRDLWFVLVPMLAVVLVSLWFAFKRWTEVLLSLAALALSGLLLLTVMRLAGWSWDLLNLMALPLLLGCCVDYGIHMQMALRRHGGDLALARRTTGRALLLCAATTATGFGSLAWSSNAGLASLGLVCATGVAAAFIVAWALLPGWWLALCGAPVSDPARTSANKETRRVGDRRSEAAMEVARPSALYGRLGWQTGLCAARTLPRSVIELLCRIGAHAYWLTQPQRREVVIQNLLPLHDGDRAAAVLAAQRLFLNFTRKLADLWRFESGAPVMASFNQLAGWERFEAAHARGRGVLLVTLHLGNWELGGPILTHKGHRLLALSNPEPDPRLTELRQAARARWGVETLLVGEDPFAFVEVIKRMNAGGAVALLLDRPAEKSAVEVELFGRPFLVSNAAAELARASGCAVVPVVIVRRGDGYAAQILPEATYERAALGNREQRRVFTQEILRAFEPWLRQHPDQWYHFVPIWPQR